MPKPVLLLYLIRMNDSWFQLSEEGREEMQAKAKESFDSVGGKILVMADCEWSSGQWEGFAVLEFPDVEALQKHMADEREMGFSQHYEEMIILGTKIEEP